MDEENDEWTLNECGLRRSVKYLWNLHYDADGTSTLSPTKSQTARERITRITSKERKLLFVQTTILDHGLICGKRR